MSAKAILQLARIKGVMIATAESCTGGMVAAALTDLPGSSAIFDRGFVTYTNAAKMDLLGVSAETLRDFGAVSEQVAMEMANGARAASQAQIAVAITGIAGPGGSDHKPEGRVCFAITSAQFDTVAETIEFGAQGRDAVRRAARDHVLKLILDRLNEYQDA